MQLKVFRVIDVHDNEYTIIATSSSNLSETLRRLNISHKEIELMTNYWEAINAQKKRGFSVMYNRINDKFTIEQCRKIAPKDASKKDFAPLGNGCIRRISTKQIILSPAPFDDVSVG